MPDAVLPGRSSFNNGPRTRFLVSPRFPISCFSGWVCEIESNTADISVNERDLARTKERNLLWRRVKSYRELGTVVPVSSGPKSPGWKELTYEGSTEHEAPWTVLGFKLSSLNPPFCDGANNIRNLDHTQKHTQYVLGSTGLRFYLQTLVVAPGVTHVSTTVLDALGTQYIAEFLVDRNSSSLLHLTA